MQQSDVPNYFKHVEMRLQEEHERCLLYVDASTWKSFVATAERQLLERHIYAILDKDVELSKEINESFKQSSQARTKLPSGIEMSVHVLTTWYWPTYPPMDVRLPHEINVYQTVVLMLFNDAENLSFQDIKESIGIEDKELRWTMQSLACSSENSLRERCGRTMTPLFSTINSPHLCMVNSIQMREIVEECQYN